MPQQQADTNIKLNIRFGLCCSSPFRKDAAQQQQQQQQIMVALKTATTISIIARSPQIHVERAREMHGQRAALGQAVKTAK